MNRTSSTSTHAVPNVLLRADWAERITVAWQKQVPSIFEVGVLLEGAKSELRRGEWMAMIKSNLPFSQSMVNKLMKIAACDHLRNSDLGPHFPACWRTLYELTTLTAEQFNRGITDGAINPKMKRKDVKALCGEPAPAVHSERVKPMELLKRQLNDRVCEIVHLQEKLAYADQGSLFDLNKDTVKDIAATVIATVTESKAIAIADAIKASIKQRKQTGQTAAMTEIA